VRPGRRLPLPALIPYLFDPPDPPSPINWQALFQNDHPVEMEIGFGKGLFLLTAAQAQPSTNFVGVEICRKYQLFTATRLAKRGLSNVRLVKCDAREFLRAYVVSGSVHAIHVYFPDPWWKKRHMKRRVFVPEFAAECERVLLPGGKLHVATDVEEYFAVIADLLSRQDGLGAIPAPQVRDAAHDLDYLTNFERKFRKEGRAVHRAAYVRVSCSPNRGQTA
jgi:tRNA (guanine-N7-)-methyltransferase